MKTFDSIADDHCFSLQVHWPFTDQNTKELTPPYKETWQAMEKLVEEVCHGCTCSSTIMSLGTCLG